MKSMIKGLYMKKENLLLLVFAVIFFSTALFLRFYKINNVPPSLNWDEVSLGYSAYSILNTGKDEWGRWFPLTFEAFGDYKLPGYIYTDVLFIKLIGLNEFGVRAPSYIAGILSILFVFLITKELFKDKKIAIISAMFLSISPWHFFLSRVALEANLALCYFLIGLYLFILGLRKWYWLIGSSFFWGITLFTYNSARVFLPLFMICLMSFYFRDLVKIRRRLVIPGIVFFIFIFIAGYLAIFEDSSSRYFWVNIIDQGVINNLNESRNNSIMPEILTRLVYNRYIYFIQTFIINYLSHFSLEYLFFEGGTQYQFSVPYKGLVYLFELPLFLYGLINIFKFKSISGFSTKRIGLIIIAWLFIAPIPSAITREAPHVLRSIFMLGAIQIVSAYAFIKMLEFLTKFRNKLISKAGYVILVGILINCSFYGLEYFYTYPRERSQSWQYGMEEMYAYLNKIDAYNNYKNIYITKGYGEPHIFYLFFNQYNPQQYFENPTLIRYSKTNWRWVDRLENIRFINDWEIESKLTDEKEAILVTTPDNYPLNAQVLKSVYFLDGTKAFDIVKL